MFHPYPCPHTFFTSQSSLHTLKFFLKIFTVNILCVLVNSTDNWTIHAFLNKTRCPWPQNTHEYSSNWMNDTCIVNLQHGVNVIVYFLQILSARLKKEPYLLTPAPSLPVQSHQPQQQYHDATPDSWCRDDTRRMDQPTSYDQPIELPDDPKLVCTKCGRQFRRGEIQKFWKHHEGCSSR